MFRKILRRKKKVSLKKGYTKKQVLFFSGAFAVVGLIVLVITFAAIAPNARNAEGESTVSASNTSVVSDSTASGGNFILFNATPSTPTNYALNLAAIKNANVPRNKNHDSSPYANTPSASLVPSNHYGPRSEYLGQPGGNPENAFPRPEGGQNRTACEFSHFAYDDPIVYPNKPGSAHLHMFFGNTDVNAYTTYDKLLNTGSSTCNGQELNRTGYWAPAMLDGNGNARIPERIVVYYKGEGGAFDKAQAYPDDTRMIGGMPDVHTLPYESGGLEPKADKRTYKCTNQFSGTDFILSNTIPSNCNGSTAAPYRTVLEMNIKFPTCWNGQDTTKPSNFTLTVGGGWYSGACPTPGFNFVNLEYYINYVVEPGEDTASWYLSSDVDRNNNYQLKGARGATTHADWWGGWHKQTMDKWLANCAKYRNPSGAASGCGFGYLSDGGPDGNNPLPGDALKYRPQWTGANKVSAQTLFNELCFQPDHTFTKTEHAALCRL